ncbi:MAG: diguanylate cyclase [Eubacteriales bacterium]|nr:diguanylate cyclase [Eubacteriales bacterium]
MINAAGVAVAFSALIYFRNTDRYEPVAYIAIAALILCQISFYQIVQYQNYGLIWMSMVPPFAYFLLRRKAARIAILLFFGYMLYFILSNMPRWSPAGFNAQAVFNILGASLSQLLMISYYEKTREDVWHELNGTILLMDESRNDLRLILDSSAEAIYGIDKEGNCTFCNRSCLEMLGYSNEKELLGKNMHRQIHHSRDDGSPYPEEDCRIFKAFSLGESAHTEDEVFWRRDGTSFAVEYSSFPKIKNGDIVGAVITFMDISQRKEREAEINYLSFYDALTGLQNRRCFEENRAAIDTRENLPLSVIAADINWLKMTNDIFGHAAGDELIQKASAIFRQVCRPGDIIARIGGDEFVLLLPRTSREGAMEILSEIKSLVAGVRVAAIRCSISAGVSTKTNPSQSLDDVMLDADNGMYMDKTINRKSENRQMLDTVIGDLHTKYPREKQHSAHTQKLCARLGAALKLPANDVSKLEQAAYLHDIGKIVLDRKIMEKDVYSREEISRIMQHPLYGYRILSLFDDTLDIAGYIYSHHEKWDGTGYPKGLVGEQIPLISRIIAVCEAYARVAHTQRLPAEERNPAAIHYIREGAGSQFDPQIADALIQLAGSPEKA